MHISKLFPLIIAISVLLLSELSASSIMQSEDELFTKLDKAAAKLDNDRSGSASNVPNRKLCRPNDNSVMTSVGLVAAMIFAISFVLVLFLAIGNSEIYDPPGTNQTDSNYTFFE